MAFKRDEWDALGKRAERKAQTEPGLVAQMAEAAAACLVGALLAPPPPKAAPRGTSATRPEAVMSDDGASGGRGDGVKRSHRPRTTGWPAPVGDAVFFSLDDASWLGDVIDTSFDGVGTVTRIQRLGERTREQFPRGTEEGRRWHHRRRRCPPPQPV